MSRTIFTKIAKVLEGSPAFEAGLQQGDELLSIDGQPVPDILEYRFLSAEEELELEIRRDGQEYECAISKGADENLGLEFEEDLFDGLHTCRNNCIFCFLQQMPKGLRETLYVRDDDYRLSFVHGNYITLTNVSDSDMDRICSQRMSPMYISVQSTDPVLRTKLLRNKNAANIMEQLHRLASARINFHAQVVLCPGINDGEHLERTIKDLSALYPWVASIGVVPVGLTKYRENLTHISPYDSNGARDVIRICKKRQEEFKENLGTRLVFPSDEFYLLSGTEFPSSEEYEEYPQLENGIGLSRIFLDELDEISGNKDISVQKGNYILVTGMLSHPLVQKLADALDKYPGVEAKVCAILNNYLGNTITVTGLLAGEDVIRALHCKVEPDEVVFIPDVALNEDNRFIDDISIQELQDSIGSRVVAIKPSPIALIECIRGK